MLIKTINNYVTINLLDISSVDLLTAVMFCLLCPVLKYLILPHETFT